MTFTSTVSLGFRPDQLVLEAGDQLIGAEGEVEILRRTAREFHTVDAADEIDRGHVFILGGLALAARSE